MAVPSMQMTGSAKWIDTLAPEEECACSAKLFHSQSLAARCRDQVLVARPERNRHAAAV